VVSKCACRKAGPGFKFFNIHARYWGNSLRYSVEDMGPFEGRGLRKVRKTPAAKSL
jgi:hypothetical protein